ncbi:hypothetical protein [Nitrospira sp. Kam-Ns4a]
MRRPARRSGWLLALTWIALALSVTASADVVEDLVFEEANPYAASAAVPPDEDDGISNVWVSPSENQLASTTKARGALAEPVAAYAGAIRGEVSTAPTGRPIMRRANRACPLSPLRI